ncbi:MAG: queuosine salvage family protein [Candidatus Calescibacterium sp.]|nr:queuosine salvage family protein [Candidatus Calescibacterium sp.]MCX7972576.1 queuosine salvage family protein [bacterium]MDW8195789.1 queuosine salvage family protein [Candidatus Calescibacterium sp.]
MIGNLLKSNTITDEIRQSCRLVVQNSKYVKINFDAINSFVSEFSNELKGWDVHRILSPEIHYTDDPLKAIWYFFVLDSVNFCFWAEKKSEKWKVRYKDKYLDGYDALAVCIKREAENSNVFTYPYYWAKIFVGEFMRMIYPTYEDLYYVCGELRLIEERVTNLRELGENIFEKPLSDMYKNIFWKGLDERNIQGKIKEEEADPYKLSYNQKNNPEKILDILVQANQDVNKFISIIIDNFRSYRDYADYQLSNGRVIKVGFYKRAQILAHDLYLLYQYYSKNKPEFIQKYPFIKYLNFKNINKLTAFADYKLPQYLHYKGILSYTDDLIKEIESGKLISSKDRKEVEIRACTVIAIEEIANRTKSYPAIVDNVIWNLAKQNPNLPKHHRTITIYY